MPPTRAFLAALLALSAAACDARPGTNPPGTGATRALDRAAGTNNSGAYPGQSDGMPGNPTGTAVGRAVDGAVEGATRR